MRRINVTEIKMFIIILSKFEENTNVQNALRKGLTFHLIFENLNLFTEKYNKFKIWFKINLINHSSLA